LEPHAPRRCRTLVTSPSQPPESSRPLPDPPVGSAASGAEPGQPGTERDAAGVFGYGQRDAWWKVGQSEEAIEQRFIERLKSYDERAFNELVQSYEQRVFRLVFRMLGRRDEAEDMTQEVFVQVFKAVAQFRGDSKLSTWIYKIAVNLCKNRSKYLARRKSDAQQELPAGQDRADWNRAKGVTSGEVARPDQLALGHELEHIVRSSISQLEPEFREVLVLRDVEDLSYDEIGEITGLAEGTVKSRIHRARAMLKEKVERALGEKIA
jgi:RNA polymerase sigma-70 factor (ECF subfamily)